MEKSTYLSKDFDNLFVDVYFDLSMKALNFAFASNFQMRS